MMKKKKLGNGEEVIDLRIADMNAKLDVVTERLGNEQMMLQQSLHEHDKIWGAINNLNNRVWVFIAGLSTALLVSFLALWQHTGK